jgi:hypothetical protein
MLCQGIFYLERELWLDGCLGADPVNFGIALADDLCDWEGGEEESLCLQVSVTGGKYAVPLSNYTKYFT